MITKEKIKEEIDKLPEGMLDQVYFWLKRFTSKSRTSKSTFTIRDFKGRWDESDIRKNAYE